MRVCISSILTTSILITIWIIIFCPLMKSKKVLKTLGINWIFLFFGCVLFRMFVPVEFFYTYTIRFTKVFTTIRKALTYEIEIWNHRLELYCILIGVWIAGIIFVLIKKIFDYLYIKKVIMCDGIEASTEMQNEISANTALYKEIDRKSVM